jgi:hypothetical protein
MIRTFIRLFSRLLTQRDYYAQQETLRLDRSRGYVAAQAADPLGQSGQARAGE